MRELKKQDRTSSRLPTDTERKYKLGQIELTKEELDQLKSQLVIDEYLSTTSSNAIANKTVTIALNNKVTKEANKGLSSNDFTDVYKKKVDELVIGDDSSSTNIYSEEEQVVGVWINNKPIYRKVYKTSDLAQEIHLNPNLSDVETFTRINGIVKRTNSFFNELPCTYINWEIYMYDFSNDNVTLKFSDNQWNAGIDYIIIIFEYTKTTD